ncbi:MAG: M20/M25/M40 family metallo-hydrolase [Planctomycetota bacterium]|jgi:acetylornithine deacetylase
MNKPDLEKIKHAVGQHKDEATKLLQQLIKIPSINRPPTGDEKEVQQFYYNYLKSTGLKTEIFEPKDVPQFQEHPGRLKEHDMKNRPNVVGTLKGKGSGKSLMLIAHADVEKPGDNEQWIDKNPFSGDVRDNRVYGRGAGDNKCGMAINAMVPRILTSAGIELYGDLIVASVSDEEQGGGNGTVALIAKGYKTDASIYLDGCNNDICISNLGGGCCDIDIEIPADQNEKQHLETYFHDFQKKLGEFNENRKKLLARHPQYNIPYYAEICTKITNIYLSRENPAKGNFTIWFCLLPDEDPEVFKKGFENFITQTVTVGSYNIHWMSRFLLASHIEQNHPFVTCLKESFELSTNRPAQITGANMCDIGFVNKYGGFPCLLFGPSRMDGEGAFHHPNEFINVDDFMDCLETTVICAMKWCDYSTKS